LLASFDGADSLLNKIDGASIGSAPIPPTQSVVSDVVAYDPAETVVEKVAEAATPAASTTVSLPAVEMPVVEMPSIELPSIEIPSIEIPSIEIPSIGGLDLPLPVLGGIAIAVLVAISAGASGRGEGVSGGESGGESEGETAPSSSSSSALSSSSSSPASPDLSIPYDAAAMLAYEEAGKPGDFESFKKKYVADTVAMVKAKTKVKA
jgi:hypothetical protein